MTQPAPFHRSAGHGRRVVCFHSNASHAGQWRALTDRLSSRFEVVAVDSYGAGKSPEFTSPGPLQLADEVNLVAPLLESDAGQVFLVGHSYGAAVALKAALMHPHRVAGLALYEPTVFSLVLASGEPARVNGIRDAVAGAEAALVQGNTDAASRAFIDFWMGDGAWAQTPVERKPAIERSIRHVGRWGHTLTTEPASLQDCAASITMPVLYMTGDASPDSSLAVADLLVPALPHARHLRFPALGHMGPITHPEEVNAAIEEFLVGV
ncbi:alpha/beta fold hydrolase [Caenimonas sp. SL110]|uniref:alpha/beta fold hydrolase n=1 Tax=Caenimonas sp. SL110 TaxID=1450524 RepID=UPI00065490B0|nr:alpha/beta hydrolase [Caenimonas sp. SL110]